MSTQIGDNQTSKINGLYQTIFFDGKKYKVMLGFNGEPVLERELF